MKKYSFPILVLFFILNNNPIDAQNWAPIDITTLNNYKKIATIGSVPKPFRSITVESSALGGGGMLHTFNTRSYTSGSLFYAYKPHFLQHQMLDEGNGRYHFYDPDTFSINALANLNDSWVFDAMNNDTATVTSVYQGMVLGALDSIKEISLSSGRQIMLSQNYGIISFPDTGTAHFELVGIEYSPNTHIGVKMPNTYDVFDFQVGDIYVTELEVMQVNEGYFEKIEILGKQAQSNGYIYNVYREYVYYYFYPGSTPYNASYGNTTRSFTVGASNVAGTDELNGSISNGNVIVEVVGSTAGSLSKRKVHVPLGPHMGDSIYQTYWQMHETATCKQHFGITNNLQAGAETNLIGWVKNGVLLGDTAVFSRFFTATSVDKVNENALDFSISPQPVKGQLFIDLGDQNNSNSPIHIMIVNTAGLVVKEKYSNADQTISIDVHSLVPGIYLVKMTTETASGVQKMVIAQ